MLPLRRSVLLLARAEPRARLAHLLAKLPGWEVIEARNVEQARFLVPMRPVDVALLADLQPLTWVRSIDLPTLLVCPAEGDHVLPALQQGAMWLPLTLAEQTPELLGAALARMAAFADEREQSRLLRQELHDSRARIDRLLGLLWEAAPVEGPGRWFSQRHMLERLDEEVARVQRHGGMLSVVLGEIRSEGKEPIGAEQTGKLASWTATQIAQSKRRCDVVGRYGLDGFMMLLPQANAGEAAGACKRLTRVLAHPPQTLPAVNACFGIAGIPSEKASVQGLLSRAEERLEESRRRR